MVEPLKSPLHIIAANIGDIWDRALARREMAIRSRVEGVRVSNLRSESHVTNSSNRVAYMEVATAQV